MNRNRTGHIKPPGDALETEKNVCMYEYDCNEVLFVTHSSDLPLLQGAGTRVIVISVGTGHLRLLT